MLAREREAMVFRRGDRKLGRMMGSARMHTAVDLELLEWLGWCKGDSALCVVLGLRKGGRVLLRGRL